MQALYPIFSKAPPIPLWHDSAMGADATLFDAGLVLEEMKRQGFRQSDLAKVTSLNLSAISNIFKGKRQVKVQEAQIIYRFLGLPVAAPASDIQWVPKIGLASAGRWREAIRDYKASYPIPRGTVGPDAFAVEIEGDSMDLVLPNGGTIIVDPDQRQLYDRKIYLLRNEEGEVTVKQYRSDPARFEPVSSNPVHTTLPIGQDQFFIVGRAVHTVGDL